MFSIETKYIATLHCLSVADVSAIHKSRVTSTAQRPCRYACAGSIICPVELVILLSSMWYLSYAYCWCVCIGEASEMLHLFSLLCLRYFNKSSRVQSCLHWVRVGGGGNSAADQALQRHRQHQEGYGYQTRYNRKKCVSICRYNLTMIYYVIFFARTCLLFGRDRWLVLGHFIFDCWMIFTSFL